MSINIGQSPTVVSTASVDGVITLRWAKGEIPAISAYVSVEPSATGGRFVVSNKDGTKTHTMLVPASGILDLSKFSFVMEDFEDRVAIISLVDVGADGIATLFPDGSFQLWEVKWQVMDSTQVQGSLSQIEWDNDSGSYWVLDFLGKTFIQIDEITLSPTGKQASVTETPLGISINTGWGVIAVISAVSRTIRFFNLNSNPLVEVGTSYTFPGTESPRSICANNSLGQFGVTTNGNKLHIFDAETFLPVAEVLVGSGSLSTDIRVTYDHDHSDQYIVSHSNNSKLVFVDPSAFTVAGEMAIGGGWGSFLAISTDDPIGIVIVINGSTTSAQRFNPVTREKIGPIIGLDGGSVQPAYGEKEKVFLAFSSNTAHMRVIDAVTGNIVQNERQFPGGVRDIAYSQSRDVFALVRFDSSVSLFYRG